MPSLAQLTDNYADTDPNTGLPVEQIYTPKEQAISIRPLNDNPIVAGKAIETRPEPMPEPQASWLDNVGMAGVEDKSGKSEHPLLKQLFGLGGEERYQLWPERMVRSGSTIAGDVASGKVPMDLNNEVLQLKTILYSDRLAFKKLAAINCPKKDT